MDAGQALLLLEAAATLAVAGVVGTTQRPNHPLPVPVGRGGSEGPRRGTTDRSA